MVQTIMQQGISICRNVGHFARFSPIFANISLQPGFLCPEQQESHIIHIDNTYHMQRVNSFIVDHTRLQPGIYESQINGAYTYDVRFVAPREAVHNGVFMDPKVAHTLEHFLADYLRTKTDEEFSRKVLYVGPMGCLTGFYLLTTEPFDPHFLRKLVVEALEHILEAEKDGIPGASELTCGNYRYFDLEKAKEFIREVVIPNFTSGSFSVVYPLIEA